MASSVAVAAPTGPNEHVVQSGQTLAKIAKRYRVDLDALCEANDLKKSSKLQPGLRLTIPNDEEESDDSGKSSNSTRSDARGGTSKKSESARRSVASTASYSQYLARPTRRGWVHVMGHHGDWQGQLVGKNGRLLPKAAAALSRLLAWPRSDFVMNPRVLTLLAKVSDAFGGRTLRVVSGYRTTSYSSESKHPLGRACDFHVLGVPNTALRDYVRTFENVGVGYYPNSTFVHLDARDHDAYWIDYAGPGEPPRYTRNRVARVVTDPPIDPERAASVMKDRSANAGAGEADADTQSRRDEQGDSSASDTSDAATAASKRLVGSVQRREVTPTSVAVERESGSAAPATREPLDL